MLKQEEKKENKRKIKENKTSIKSHDGLQYICSCCKSSFLKGTIPNISVANGLELDEIPNELKDLNSLEAVFIS